MIKRRSLAILILFGVLTAGALSQEKEKKKEELKIEDDKDLSTVKVEGGQDYQVKSDLDLPQFAGEKFIKEVSAEDFESATKNKGSDIVIVFFGADWCPHCRNFKPEFNIMAHTVKVQKLYKGNYHFLKHIVGDNKEWVKKFKVEGYPTLIAIKNNKFWKYRGERRTDPILKWTQNLDHNLAEEYPNHIPGFYEELQDAVTDILQNVKVAYERDPTKMTYFFVALGGIFLLFFVCFIYAIYESCCIPEDEDDDDKKNK